MRIKRFEIEHVRALKSIALKVDEHAAVIFGRNGCGKSSLIHALAVGLSAGGAPEREFAGSDRKDHDVEPSVLIETTAGSRWTRKGGRIGQSTRTLIDVLKVDDKTRCVVVQTARPKRKSESRRGTRTGDRIWPVVMETVDRLLTDKRSPPVEWDHPNRWSDGEARLIGLFLGIAETLATTDQGQGQMNQEGIVLIDDIETLFHPKVQARILEELRTTFPEVQVIATTHSPVILSTVTKNQITEMYYEG